MHTHMTDNTNLCISYRNAYTAPTHTRTHTVSSTVRQPLPQSPQVLDPRTREQMVMAGVRDYVMSNEVVRSRHALLVVCYVASICMALTCM